MWRYRKTGVETFRRETSWPCECMSLNRISFRIKRCYIAKEIGGLLPYIGKTGKGTPHFYAVWPSATQVELWEGTCWYVHRVSRNQSAEKDFLSSDLLVAECES